VPLNATLSTGGYVVARYNTGSVLAAVKDSLGPKHVNRVDLALWPLAPINYGRLPFDYMQYDQLIVQSLLYTLSTPCMSPPLVPSPCNYTKKNKVTTTKKKNNTCQQT